MTLWSGRFSSGMDATMWDLSESYSFDHVLYAHDIQGSKAHVQGLAAADVGAKLHTARSRNDQVATTLRLFTRDAVTEVALMALNLVDALVDLSDRNDGAYLPGYTHLQRAQPVLLSHHLNAHAWSLLRR